MRAKIMPINKISAKVEITAVNVTTYVIGPFPCNEACNQVLYFIAEEASKIANVDNITVIGFPVKDTGLLTLHVEKVQELYGDISLTFEDQPDDVHTEESEAADSKQKSASLDIEGVAT